MATFKHGRDTEVWLDGSDLTEVCNKADVNVDVDVATVSVFRRGWKNAVEGQASAGIDLGGVYDPLVVALPDIIEALADSVLTVCPGSAALADPTRMAEVIESNYKEGVPVGGAVEWSASMAIDGALDFGVVVHPMIAEDEDEPGDVDTPIVDLGVGSSAVGAVAHLHVTSVSAGDSIVVEIQDASVATGGGANWASINTDDGLFASKSAVGAERLVIAGTVRRYVRAVWNVTGTDPSIVFGVALART